MKQNNMLEAGKNVRLSMPSYEWLIKQSKGYGETIDQIFKRIMAEVEECRRNARK